MRSLTLLLVTAVLAGLAPAAEPKRVNHGNTYLYVSIAAEKRIALDGEQQLMELPADPAFRPAVLQMFERAFEAAQRPVQRHFRMLLHVVPADLSPSSVPDAACTERHAVARERAVLNDKSRHRATIVLGRLCYDPAFALSRCAPTFPPHRRKLTS